MGRGGGSQAASAGERVERAGLLCARVDGFDLHGDVACAPMPSVLMLTAAQRDGSTWVLTAIGLVTVSRYLHVIGMLVGPTVDAMPNVLRLVGVPGTYFGGFLLRLSTLAQA